MKHELTDQCDCHAHKYKELETVEAGHDVCKAIAHFVESEPYKLSNRSIARKLNDAGYTTVQGKPFSHVQIGRILAKQCVSEKCINLENLEREIISIECVRLPQSELNLLLKRMNNEHSATTKMLKLIAERGFVEAELLTGMGSNISHTAILINRQISPVGLRIASFKAPNRKLGGLWGMFHDLGAKR